MESTDLRIFAVVTVLTLIIYADPGTAGGGSARAAEDTALVNLPVEEIADEFKKVRGIKGPFDGGAWNDEADKWMGRKHRLMIEFGLRLAGGNYEKSDIIMESRILGDLFSRPSAFSYVGSPCENRCLINSYINFRR